MINNDQRTFSTKNEIMLIYLYLGKSIDRHTTNYHVSYNHT